MISGMIFAMAMQTLPAPTLPDWQQIGADEAGSFAVFPSSISRSGSEVSTLVRIDVTRGQRTGARVIGVLRYVYNCTANSFRMEVGDLYDASGTYLAAAPLTDEHRRDRPVPDGTPNAAVRDHLCRRG